LKLSTGANVLPQKSAGIWYRTDGETAKAEPKPRVVAGQPRSVFAAVRARGLPQEGFGLDLSHQPVMDELRSHNFQAVEVLATNSPPFL
jgi:hypothetical protein